MDDLIAKLKAALDEDERLATIAADYGPEWYFSDGIYPSDGSRHPGPIISDIYGTREEYGEHIVRHDPARVLRDVTADRKILAWHPVETRTVNETTEYTCPCLWDPHMEEASWHPEVICELTGIVASRYGLELTPCVCRDCTPKSQWAERGYGIEERSDSGRRQERHVD